jgi:hypothetical protein
MRSLAAQLLIENLDLMPYAFENFANKAVPASVPQLRRLLGELLTTIPKTRIFIDGLDEYPEIDQRAIIQEIFSLTKDDTRQCKVMFSSREGKEVDRYLRNKPTISFRDNNADVDNDIKLYIDGSETFRELRERFPNNEDLIHETKEELTNLADSRYRPHIPSEELIVL